MKYPFIFTLALNKDTTILNTFTLIKKGEIEKKKSNYYKVSCILNQKLFLESVLQIRLEEYTWVLT